jgi:hypothetical protein
MNPDPSPSQAATPEPRPSAPILSYAIPDVTDTASEVRRQGRLWWFFGLLFGLIGLPWLMSAVPLYHPADLIDAVVGGLVGISFFILLAAYQFRRYKSLSVIRGVIVGCIVSAVSLLALLLR